MQRQAILHKMSINHKGYSKVTDHTENRDRIKQLKKCQDKSLILQINQLRQMKDFPREAFKESKPHLQNV